MRLFRRRKESYRAAARVEEHREAAQALRTDHPEMYSNIVEQAKGTAAEAAAQRDPDAFVALFLAQAQDAGVFNEGSDVEAPKSDSEYWPHLDVEVVHSRVADFFAQNEAGHGQGHLAYPAWAVRRYVAVESPPRSRIDKAEDQL